MKLAPIALFVYNRPLHTRQTVEALQKNELARESDLFIFSDASKKPEAAATVGEVREYIKTITGFKSVSIIERDKNWGLANSIIDGVSRLCDESGRVIVLEDDIVTVPSFLQFMNGALNVYEGEEQVMHVSGYMFPVKNPEVLPETFFFRVPTCWGWATWKRAWNFFEPDADYLLEQIMVRKNEYEFDLHGAVSYMAMLKNQATGLIDSWAVRWYASIFLKNGICLHPAISLTKNIGLDGTGKHCNSCTTYDVNLSNARPTVIHNKVEIKELYEGLASIIEFNLSLQRPWYIRIYNVAVRRMREFFGLALR